MRGGYLATGLAAEYVGEGTVYYSTENPGGFLGGTPSPDGRIADRAARYPDTATPGFKCAAAFADSHNVH